MTHAPSFDSVAGDGSLNDSLIRSAGEHAVRAWMRVPISVVVSGFLFTFVSVEAGALWLCILLGFEAIDGWVKVRVAAGDTRYVGAHLGCILVLSLCWVVHALLLWRTGALVPQIAAIMDLFTVALYGAIGGHKDRRLLLVLVAPPLATLIAVLGHLLWTTMPAPVAMLGTLATLGSSATIVANAIAMHRSDRKLFQANAALEHERTALEARVRERTADLSQAMALAQQANVAKSQFLATMSHELRTPLNAMIGYAEILEEDLRTDASAARPDDAARIVRAARVQLAMVNDILDLSRAEAGAIVLETVDVDVRALLEGVAAETTPLAQANGNTLEVEIEGQVGVVSADARRLLQCVLNLVSNACKFTRDGRVTLAARVVDGRWLDIDVIDTGCGIDAEQLGALFRPFVQGDASATRQRGGAGLGLVLTRSLIELMGGAVTVISAPGQGSTFTLRAPV